MSNTTTTAVDWLIDQTRTPDWHSLKRGDIIEQAVKMDIQQKEYMFNCGRQFQLTGECTFKQVMEETYGKPE